MAAPNPTSTKDRIDILQSITTIIAVIIGGFWTYDVFIKERRNVPHANIEHRISHLTLAKNAHLLRVGIELSNAGGSMMGISQSIVRVQQILPQVSCAGDPCAVNQLKIAATEIDRKEDRFAWPLIAERNVTTRIEIEPGEKQSLDYEFVVPATTKAVRVYTYFKNDQKSKKSHEMGWYTSSFYEFSTSHDGEKK